jgi:hypothetical protein
MDDIRVTFLDDDEPLPPDVEILPDIKDMDVEDAVRLLRSQGLDEVDARFEVALERGEIDGDAYAVDDNGKRVRSPRQDRASA